MFIYDLTVLFEQFVTPSTTCVLQFVNRLWIEEMLSTFNSILKLTTHIKRQVVDCRLFKSGCMSQTHLFSNNVKANAPYARGSPGEILIDNLTVNTNRLKDLRATVSLSRGDAHLGDHFDDALINCSDVIRRCGTNIGGRDQTSLHHVL